MPMYFKVVGNEIYQSCDGINWFFYVNVEYC